MDKFVKPVVLEKWNRSKGQFEEIKDTSLKFWKEDKLYFQIETIQEPTTSWSSGVIRAIAHSRYIIWWAEGIEPHLCFRGTFNSEEELTEFLLKFKEFVISPRLADEKITFSTSGGMASYSQEADLISFHDDLDDNILNSGVIYQTNGERLGFRRKVDVQQLEPKADNGNEETVNSKQQKLNDAPCLTQMVLDKVGISPCTSSKTLSDDERKEVRPNSLPIMKSSPRKRRLEDKRPKANEVRQRKRKKVVGIPIGIHKRVTRSSKSDILLNTIKSAFQFILSEEELDVLVLSKSSETIHIRTACNHTSLSAGSNRAHSEIQSQLSFGVGTNAKDNSKESKEDVSSQETGLENADCSEGLNAISSGKVQFFPSSNKWSFTVVMIFTLFLLTLGVLAKHLYNFSHINFSL